MIVKRRTPQSASGEPIVWVFGLALVASLAAIVVLIGMIVVRASESFWVRPIEQLTLADGSQRLGSVVRREVGEGGVSRTLYQVGNRDLGQGSFTWIADREVEGVSRPAQAVMLERSAWGVWFGLPTRIVRLTEGGAEPLGEGDTFWAEFERQHAEAIERERAIEALDEGELADVNREREAWRLRIADVRRRASESGGPAPLPVWAWGVAVLAACGAGAGAVAVRRVGGARAWRLALAVLAFLAVGFVAIEAPWVRRAPSAAEVAAVQAEAEKALATLDAEAASVEARIKAIEAEDAKYRVEVVDPLTGRFAPESLSSPDVPMRVSQVVRVVRANELSFGEKLRVLGARWWEFLSPEPREANSEGGVFPVIFGTVALTILLSLAVVPLGVVAALYLREYAKQGLMTSVLRVAVNNLAGVPSVVYGVFGLGFFCYAVGGYVDTGPAEPLPRLPWWGLVAAMAVIMAAALTLGAGVVRGPGRRGWGAGLCWSAAVVLLIVVVMKTPYFDGFFATRAAEGSPTFGARGILWASLTLALLTLPVVIVATEEAIAAVPRSMREGSYGCGATKWQTVRRVVIPGALPGIMTGAILAMARGAGEVAPLMLVGAAKHASELPVSTDPPYLHLDRTFMHLGYHIFDLGYMSQDLEATRPLVWTTTLLLIAIVLILNSIAIAVRGRLRGRLVSAAV